MLNRVLKRRLIRPQHGIKEGVKRTLAEKILLFNISAMGCCWSPPREHMLLGGKVCPSSMFVVLWVSSLLGRCLEMAFFILLVNWTPGAAEHCHVFLVWVTASIAVVILFEISAVLCSRFGVHARKYASTTSTYMSFTHVFRVMSSVSWMVYCCWRTNFVEIVFCFTIFASTFSVIGVNLRGQLLFNVQLFGWGVKMQQCHSQLWIVPD
jgi:hypothetical protein